MAAIPSSHPILLLLMFYLSNITFALPSDSLPSLQLPNTNIPTAATANQSLSVPMFTPPLHAGRSIECFGPDTPRTDSVIVEDCDFAIEAIMRDPAGVMSMTKFTHTPELFEYGVPAHWSIGGCVIILTSGNDSATDTFQLVDVIIKARAIVEECSLKSKTHLGGVGLVGHGKTFFVAVNGFYVDPDDPDLDGRDNSTRLVLAQGGEGSGMSGVGRRFAGRGKEEE